MAVDVWPRETGHTLLGSTGALERKISVAYSELLSLGILTCCCLYLVGGALATLKFASDFLTPEGQAAAREGRTNLIFLRASVYAVYAISSLCLC